SEAAQSKLNSPELAWMVIFMGWRARLASRVRLRLARNAPLHRLRTGNALRTWRPTEAGDEHQREARGRITALQSAALDEPLRKRHERWGVSAGHALVTAHCAGQRPRPPGHPRQCGGAGPVDTPIPHSLHSEQDRAQWMRHIPMRR